MSGIFHGDIRRFSQCSDNLYTGSFFVTPAEPSIIDGTTTPQLPIADSTDKLSRTDREFKYNVVKKVEAVLIYEDNEGTDLLKSLVVRKSDMEGYYNLIKEINPAGTDLGDVAFSSVIPIVILRCRDKEESNLTLPSNTIVTFPLSPQCARIPDSSTLSSYDLFTNEYSWYDEEELIIWTMDYPVDYVSSGGVLDLEDTDLEVYLVYPIFDGCCQKAIYSNEDVILGSIYTT